MKSTREFERPDDFYEAAADLHRDNGRIRIAANTPGLLLPSEVHLSPKREAYFAAIWKRLEGDGDYSLDYLFETEAVESALRQYRISGQEELIKDTTRNLERAMACVANGRLRLRHRNFHGTLSGKIIVDETAVAYGQRERGEPRTKNWVIRADAALARSASHDFDTLFDPPSEDMTPAALAAMIGRLPPRTASTPGYGSPA